ncbi:MAG: peptidylprolyl isomerase [Chloroflexota bacterium]
MTSLKMITATFVLLLAAGCGGAPAATQSPASNTISTPTLVAAQPTNAVQPTNETGDKLVAKVNGEGITEPEFDRALARKLQEVEAASPDTLKTDVLNQMIEERLIIQGAQAQNIVVTDADVQTELQAQIQEAGGDAGWKDWLKTNLYTAEEFPQVLRTSLISNKVRDTLTADLEGNVKQVHARHILLRTESDAKDILTKLTNGEDFAALAAQYSQDETTRERGGDLGWFTSDELLTPQLSDTAFKLQAGQIAGPIATELGYHVIQVIEIADRPVEAERRVYISQTRFENWLKPLYAKAVIERYTG